MRMLAIIAVVVLVAVVAAGGFYAMSEAEGGEPVPAPSAPPGGWPDEWGTTVCARVWGEQFGETHFEATPCPQP
jgi:hypothetical protein